MFIYVFECEELYKKNFMQKESVWRNASESMWKTIQTKAPTSMFCFVLLF